MIDSYVKFVKAHEKMMAIFAVVVIFYLGIVKFEGMWAKHEENLTNADKQQLQVLVADQTASAKSNAAIAAEYKIVADQANATIAQLEAAIAQNAKATQAQMAKDATLAPSDLAIRWITLAQLPIDSIKVSGDLLMITEPAALKTTQVLEEFGEATKNVAALSTERTSLMNELGKANERIDGLNQEVGKDQAVIAQADKTCQQEIKTVKDEAAKGKMKAAVIGGVVALILKAVLTAAKF